MNEDLEGFTNKVPNIKKKEGDTMSLVLASRATVYDRYAISRRFSTQETAINVVQGNIALLVSASEIEELKNGNKTMYSRLSSVEVNLNSITLAVSSSEYKDINGVLNAITQARASIVINSQEIELKVSKNSIISSINQSAEAVQIAANKIALTGNGVIDILNSGTTTINARRINLNGIVTANENFKILSDGSMEARNGKFIGDINGGSACLDSRIVADKDVSGQLMIVGDGLINRCILSDDRLQFTNGSFFARDTNMIDIRLDRDSSVKNQIIMRTNMLKHPNISFYENEELKTSIGGDGVSAPDVHSFGNLYGEFLLFGRASTPGSITIGDYAWIKNLSVSGHKNRIVETEHFGVIAQSAYETAEPMFGDVGHGIINKYGECVIFIDPKFAETVSTEYGYYVFITKYSAGDVWVEKKELATFTISGTPGLEFDWEIKAHQKGYEHDRLKQVEVPN